MQQYGIKYFTHIQTIDPGGGIKRSKQYFFSESSRVAYQIKGKEL